VPRLPAPDHGRGQGLRHKYQKGISCPRCYDSLTEEQKARFAEREKQIRLARERGEAHVGAEAAETIEARRQAKKAQQQASGEG